MRNIGMPAIILAIGLGLIVVFLATNSAVQIEEARYTVPYSEFLSKIKHKEISEVLIDEGAIYGYDANRVPYKAYAPNDPGLLGDLVANNVVINAAPKSKPSFLSNLLISWVPFIAIIALWVYFFRKSQGGAQGGAFRFGKTNAKTFNAGQVNVKLADVAGVEEAKEEVGEIVDFLKDAERFRKVGGQIPRGVLMVGPPGTGKTLLAKAIAGEANVPFFFISGSDFVEMFVGVGAARVRDLFQEAKKAAPCIVFIDEIDAVGRRRGTGIGGGNDEREQTLNQLLVEMDGFEGTEGIIVIAATNRPDVLDKALLRPGRFDRQVVVPLPDVRGREQILRVHMRKVPASANVDAAIVARGTPGFAGADLANLVNEAALFAARARRETVTMDDFERAKDKIMMGAERRSMVMSESEKRLTAYHEAGHAIVGLCVPEHDPVHKVSIIPRGRALGVTMYLPEEDRVSYSKRRLESQLASLYGGRIAEEIIFGADSVTTGASNDIQRATDLATNMVKKWGLSATIGPRAFTEEEGSGFLGQGQAEKAVAPSTAEAIDQEINRLLDENYARAKAILGERLSILHNMANALIEYETLERDQVAEIMAGRTPQPPRDRQSTGPDKPTHSGDSGGTPTLNPALREGLEPRSE
jgi:cell division protease FtsH